MKTGRSLQDLAVEIKRQAATKRDYIVEAEGHDVALSAFNDGGTKGVRFMLPEVGLLDVNPVAHGQIAEHAGIPTKYYDRMLAEAPELLTSNVNEWFRRYPAPRLVRSLDGRTRAFLSNSYQPLENIDLANAVLPVLLSRNLQIISAEITDTRLYIKAVDRKVEAAIQFAKQSGAPRVDVLSPAVMISNSEVGFGALTVAYGTYTGGCTNLAWLRGDYGLKRRHVGARNILGEGEKFAHLLSNEARQKRDEATFLEVRDVVAGSLNEIAFRERVEKIAETTDRPVKNPVKLVEVGAKQFGWTGEEQDSILNHLINGADLSQYGVFNAVTRAAQDRPSYDRASELEQQGGQIIDLPANQWRVLAEAA